MIKSFYICNILYNYKSEFSQRKKNKIEKRNISDILILLESIRPHCKGVRLLSKNSTKSNKTCILQRFPTRIHFAPVVKLRSLWSWRSKGQSLPSSTTGRHLLVLYEKRIILLNDWAMSVETTWRRGSWLVSALGVSYKTLLPPPLLFDRSVTFKEQSNECWLKFFTYQVNLQQLFVIILINKSTKHVILHW